MKNGSMESARGLESIEAWLRAALAEDLGPGDLTTGLFVPAGALGRARVVAKAPGVVAGLDVARAVLRYACEGIADESVPAAAGGADFAGAFADGDRVAAGDVVLEATGPARGLLAGERTALNFLMRLSGVATSTARFVAAVAGTGARILDTRKTTPGWRLLERAAVVAGGGHNHRYALYDAVLVKENHLAFAAAEPRIDAGARADAREPARSGVDSKRIATLAAALARRPPGMLAVVEAESIAEYRWAAAAGADVVMLDEFSPADVAAVRAERGAAVRPLLEVSGGVTLENVRAFAEAGVERISIGALTHSAPPLDLSMHIEPSAGR